MTPTKTAAQNLTDYLAQVESRVISPFQATTELPAGTREFRAVVWNKADDKEVSHSGWVPVRGWAFSEAEMLLNDLEAALEKKAEEAAELEMAS